jgi:hypothetical protein
MTPGPWTQTTVGSDTQRARWSQLKRIFATPVTTWLFPQPANWVREREEAWRKAQQVANDFWRCDR